MFNYLELSKKELIILAALAIVPLILITSLLLVVI